MTRRTPSLARHASPPMLHEDRPCARAYLQHAEAVAFKMLPRCHELLVGILPLQCVARVHIAKHRHIAPGHVGINDGSRSGSQKLDCNLSFFSPLAHKPKHLRPRRITAHAQHAKELCPSRHVLRVGSRSFEWAHRSVHSCTLPGSPTTSTDVNIQHVEASRESAVRPFQCQLACRSWDLTRPALEGPLLQYGCNGLLAHSGQQTCAADHKTCQLILAAFARLPPTPCFLMRAGNTASHIRPRLDFDS